MRSRLVAPVAMLAVALLAASCSGSDGNVSAPVSGGASGARSVLDGNELVWGSCENRLARAANLECARLMVPLDPHRPRGDSIELALARQRATGPGADHIGSLVVNPGGPGGSGIEFLATAAMMFPAELRERFDLVSFDPRGVGESTPVNCLSDKQKADQLNGDLTPSTPAETTDALADQHEMLEACEKNSARMMRHMSTSDVAADLDRIRLALGDEKLTYAGFSYGTAIGAVYATLFPTSVRAVMLDGSVDPTGSIASTTLGQAMGFERALDDFVAQCDRTTRCALAPNSRRRITSTRSRLAKRPVEIHSSHGIRSMGVDQFDLALATGLYDPSMWGVLADSIDTVDSGGADILFMLMDQQTGRKPDGSFDNSSDAQTMVNCADSSERLDRDQAVDLAQKVEAAAPNFGAAIGWASLSCIGWPEAANPVPKVSVPAGVPILVVGTKGDPATPYSWSESMASTLGSASLLTYEGSGHTAFLKAGPCVDDAVTTFLVDLQQPPAGSTCPTATDKRSFEGLIDQAVDTMTRSGIPEEVAHCIVGSAVKELGEAEFTRMLLSQDTDEVSRLIMAKTLSCVQMKAPR